MKTENALISSLVINFMVSLFLIRNLLSEYLIIGNYANISLFLFLLNFYMLFRR